MPRRHLTMRAYVWTFVALFMLSLLTFGLSFVSLGDYMTPIALAIATVKATLVVLFFMHLVEQPATNGLILVFCVIMLALLVGLTSADVVTRPSYVRDLHLSRAREPDGSQAAVSGNRSFYPTAPTVRH